MDFLSNVSRRSMFKWGLASAGLPVLSSVLGGTALAQEGMAHGRDSAHLFPGEGLPGGGQLEIRLAQSIYTSDPDRLEVAQRLIPFDPESWYSEWMRVGEKNEKKAEAYLAEGNKVSANQFYMRAHRFYRTASWPQAQTDPRMLPTYKRMREMFDKAWELRRPPFERISFKFEGNTLHGYFRKPRGPEGKRFPTVIAHQGADSMAEITIMGGASSYVARGMAYLVVDIPGQGAALRLQDLHMPPDTERVFGAMIDYLETRPDVDASRIGAQGISMGGYGTPRAASGEKRIKAVWTSAASHDLLRDIFDYYPPIQDRVAWIIGADGLEDARKKLAEYTLADVAKDIECPMLIGYGATDRIMDPQGAVRLYDAAVNSKRELVGGMGHAHHPAKAGGPQELRLPIQQDWAAKQLGAEA